MSDVILLDKSDSRSWALLPVAIARIHEYDKDHDPWFSALSTYTETALMQDFVSQQPRFFIALVMVDDEILGHIFAGVDFVRATPIVAVYQTWRTGEVPDIGRVFVAVRDMLDEWARERGLTHIRTPVINDAVARLWRTIGYEVGPRIIMRDVPELGG